MSTSGLVQRSGFNSSYRLVAVLAASVALLAASCTDSGNSPQGYGSGEVAIGLRTDLSCDELLEASQLDAELAVELNNSLARAQSADGSITAGEDMDSVASAESAPSDAMAGEPGGAGGEVVAGTNIQEAGVDEGDILKTDGNRIVTLSGTTLRVVMLDGSPEVDGELVLPSDGGGDVAEMFLRGDELVVLIPSWGRRVAPDIAPLPEGLSVEPPSGETPSAETSVVPFNQGLRIVRVDISDPTSPEMVEESIVEGDLVASRMVDGTVRVIVRAPGALTEELWSVRDANDVEQLFEEVKAADLLPQISVDGEISALGGCGDLAMLPASTPATDAAIASRSLDYTSAPETVTVLTIGDDLADMAPVSVAGLADIVYASTDSLYVTNTGWTQGGPNTFVHHFDTAGSSPAVYTGSGIVPGAPLNQYALSESGDHLRIVTTTEDPTAFEDQFIEEGPIDEQTIDTDEPVDGVPIDDLPAIGDDIDEPDVWVPATEGRLTVLSPSEDGTLTEIGSIEDLGVGEEVQSVRFLGDMAYVVTFRQTDPLYAIDLSDPTRPTALGELKITGFSEYLHPVGEGLLLGIGREATEDGMDIGFKASLFDVSDPTNPSEVDKFVAPDGWSEVGNDPHAFTWDPVAGHAVFPLEQYERFTVSECPLGESCDDVAASRPSNGAVVLAIGAEGIREVARLAHNTGSGDQWLDGIRRSVVIDRDLWTMSHTGLGLTDADEPGPTSFVAF